MNKFNKIIALFLALVLAISITACTSSANSTSDTTESSTVDTQITTIDGVQHNTATDTSSASSPSATEKETSKPKEEKDETTTTDAPETSTTAKPTKPTQPTSTTTKPSITTPTTTTPVEVKPSVPKPAPKPTTSVSDKGNTTTDKVVVKVEDIPVKNEDDIKDIEISTPDIKEEVKVETVHTPISANNYYQYSKLSSSEKKIYNKLVKAIENTTNVIKLDRESISYDKALVLLQKTLADNPQYFWVSKSASILYNADTKKVTAFILYYTDGKTMDKVDKNYNLIQTANRDTINTKISKLNAEIQTILKEVPVNCPQIEKEKIIHDYIIKNLTYDYDAASKSYDYGDNIPHAFDLYGAVCKRKAVCEGYSKMFQYLCYNVGINSTQVVGHSAGVNHMWNTAKIDGDWYQVDTTWNDTSVDNLSYYGFFNLTSSEMYKDHTILNDNLAVPNCNSDKYAFYNYYALNVTDLTSDAENYKFVIDNIIKEKSPYLIVSTYNADASKISYLKPFILNPASSINNYIKEKNYNISFENRYRQCGKYLYIPVVYS